MNFLQGQLPDVIRQLLLYNAVRSAAVCVLCCAIIACSWFLAVRKEAEWKREGNWPNRGLAYFMALVASVFAAVPLFISGFDWLQIWLAPKLYLIEYAAHLAK